MTAETWANQAMEWVLNVTTVLFAALILGGVLTRTAIWMWASCAAAWRSRDASIDGEELVDAPEDVRTDPMSAPALIAEKMRTNREHKGYTADHDDTHDKGELIYAARCYIDTALRQIAVGDAEPAKDIVWQWPFEEASWRPSDSPIRNLVHAGALIGAEIERLKRARDGAR